MMYLVLCTAPNPGAWLLRFVMWSRWSHSAILDEDDQDGVVYDSTLLGGGVRATSMVDFLDHYPKNELRLIAVDPDRIDEARAWLAAQIGKRYDWTALLSWIVRRNWQDEDSWFCSELTEAFIDLFSTPRFRESVSRITPKHQDMLA